LAAQGFPVGIGMISRNDMQKRNNLLYVASYLVKIDPLRQQALPESMKRFRTFGRGEMRGGSSSRREIPTSPLRQREGYNVMGIRCVTTG
jgi:hypothetical protein